MRTYSILNEEQRRDLIKRAFEMKQVLMKKLSDTEECLKTKTEELEMLRLKLDKDSLMVDGEEEAMNGAGIKYFPLFPQRKYKEDSAAEIHFRLAGNMYPLSAVVEYEYIELAFYVFIKPRLQFCGTFYLGRSHTP